MWKITDEYVGETESNVEMCDAVTVDDCDEETGQHSTTETREGVDDLKDVVVEIETLARVVLITTAIFANRMFLNDYLIS